MTNGELLGWLGLLLALSQALGVVVNKLWLESTLKFEFRRREQAALVAALFAAWGIDRSAQERELNRLAWEATLWLPDDLATEVNKRLANRPDAKGMKEIIVDIKGLMQGRKSKMKGTDIVHY
jgi:hypothetical protein